jgi:hypothetical protein
MELLAGFEAQWPSTAQREQFTEHLAMRLRMARFKQRIDTDDKAANIAVDTVRQHAERF